MHIDNSPDLVKGVIKSVSGPVVVAREMRGAKMYDVVEVSHERLIGEVIELKGDLAVIQVYEETTGLKPGDKVVCTGMPLSAELGPGIIGSIYDGIQRPLELIRKNSGIFIDRGARPDAIDRKRKWEFKAVARVGDKVSAGMIIGEVAESKAIAHRVMVPPGVFGTVKRIDDGVFNINETVCEVVTDSGDAVKITMMQRWPVREKRGYAKKYAPSEPMITGQRVIDMFFPIAKGGTAAIPGPFGAGKTVTQHQIAKWSDADMVVYVGCGERGNEMTNVLEEFPKLIDKNTGRPLMERTVLIANTSNMPVAAREASIYTGVTIAEYYRDMGYNVALIADSTSRWAEAMREISARLEEMPGEEGYPAYLSSRLSAFYERSGVVDTISGQRGSVSIIGAVSPQGGDFSEPVTQSTLRVTKCFWALDAKLADMRHFPSINWLKSYSLYVDTLAPWYRQKLGCGWDDVRANLVRLLKRESELKEVVQLVGMDALPFVDQVVMIVSKVIREDFLQQDVYHKNDVYTNVEKQMMMMRLIGRFYDRCAGLSKGGSGDALHLKKIRGSESLRKLGGMRYMADGELERSFDGMMKMIDDEFGSGGA